MHIVWAFLLDVGTYHPSSALLGVGARVFWALLVPAAVPSASGG